MKLPGAFVMSERGCTPPAVRRPSYSVGRRESFGKCGAEATNRLRWAPAVSDGWCGDREFRSPVPEEMSYFLVDD